jgi:hypothetical protein
MSGASLSYVLPLSADLDLVGLLRGRLSLCQPDALR